MIQPIRTRADFAQLRRDGRRIRIEPLWCTHLSNSATDTVQVAFAINRAVGNAVTRNRLRRRLRALMTELALPGGMYLIGCRPSASELTFEQLRATLGRLPSMVSTKT